MLYEHYNTNSKIKNKNKKDEEVRKKERCTATAHLQRPKLG
jgi:hypothetical protein